MAKTRKMTAFFRYFGAKREAARLYPYPRCSRLIEPFAGSAGYAVTYPDRQVQLFDISEWIVGVWSYLIGVSESEFLKLPVIGEFETTEELKVPQEAKWYIGFWLQVGSTTKPSVRASSWARNAIGQKRGRLEATWEPHTRQRIANQLQFIRHWKVEQKNYRDVDNCSATWFIDPPYHKSGTSYPGGKEMDFTHLAQWSKERQGQVIVCEQEGADWLPFHRIKSRAGLNNKTTKEVVYFQ